MLSTLTVPQATAKVPQSAMRGGGGGMLLEILGFGLKSRRTAVMDTQQPPLLLQSKTPSGGQQPSWPFYWDCRAWMNLCTRRRVNQGPLKWTAPDFKTHQELPESLEGLYLEDNHLTGGIPESFGRLRRAHKTRAWNKEFPFQEETPSQQKFPEVLLSVATNSKTQMKPLDPMSVFRERMTNRFQALLGCIHLDIWGCPKIEGAHVGCCFEDQL